MYWLRLKCMCKMRVHLTFSHSFISVSSHPQKFVVSDNLAGILVQWTTGLEFKWTKSMHIQIHKSLFLLLINIWNLVLLDNFIIVFIFHFAQWNLHSGEVSLRMNKLKKKMLERIGKYTWSFIWHHLLKFHTSGISKISIIHFLNCLLTLWVSQCKRKETVALNGRWQGKAWRVSAEWCWQMPNLLTPAQMAPGKGPELSDPWVPSTYNFVLEGLYFHHQISPLAFHYPSCMSVVSYPGSWFFFFLR